jgi:hypothetical protein
MFSALVILLSANVYIQPEYYMCREQRGTFFVSDVERSHGRGCQCCLKKSTNLCLPTRGHLNPNARSAGSMIQRMLARPRNLPKPYGKVSTL